MAALKKAIFERALGAELTHRGYEKVESKPKDTDNHRNGSSRNRITRDRNDTFDRVRIGKGERRFTGFGEKIIAMYARGMACARFRAFCRRGTGYEVSPDFISTITDA